MKKFKYDILSPDGFGMYRDKTFSSPDKAWAEFEKWKERYKMQGYYSSAKYGRIPLDNLKDYCKLAIS